MRLAGGDYKMAGRLRKESPCFMRLGTKLKLNNTVTATIQRKQKVSNKDAQLSHFQEGILVDMT